MCILRRMSLWIEKHRKFIHNAENERDSFEYYVTEHLRMSGAYWGCTAMALLGSLDEMRKDDFFQWMLQCQYSNGAFGGNIGHDPHILYTLSALQILCLFDRMDLVEETKDKIADYVKGLQNSDGSFSGDEWGEVDTRFSYCALYIMKILGRLGELDVPEAVSFICKCKNFDGGYGAIPGAESHAGQIFCCVGALSIAGALDKIDWDLLPWWLCERQGKDGGLNGRPEKLSDVCYSWWVLSSLAILDRIDWIDRAELRSYILKCQDDETGGIADRPGDMPDIFHTFFGIAGLSLMGDADLPPIDPTYALPVETLVRCGIQEQPIP